jgi:hypothetical protein
MADSYWKLVLFPIFTQRIASESDYISNPTSVEMCFCSDMNIASFQRD